MFVKIKNLYQKIPKKYLVIGGIILVLVLYFAFRGGSQAGEVLTAERTKVAEEVVVIGKTKARSSVELGFDKTGRVARVYKNVGDEVMQGAVIAELEAGETSADLIKARAALDEEQVKLSEIKKSTPLEAKNAISALQTSVRDAYAVADDAVRNKTDQFFKNPTDQNPKFEVSFTDGSYVHYFKVDNDLAIDLNYRRKNIETMLRS
jgi:multidrug efflux pump subunit AcrA (membrane-fusion protein)